MIIEIRAAECGDDAKMLAGNNNPDGTPASVAYSKAADQVKAVGA